jgi:hypothetical protein
MGDRTRYARLRLNARHLQPGTTQSSQPCPVPSPLLQKIFPPANGFSVRVDEPPAWVNTRRLSFPASNFPDSFFSRGPVFPVRSASFLKFISSALRWVTAEIVRSERLLAAELRQTSRLEPAGFVATFPRCRSPPVYRFENVATFPQSPQIHGFTLYPPIHDTCAFACLCRAWL